MIDLRSAYHDKLASGDLHPDPAQLAALDALQDLAGRLDAYAAQRRPSFWRRLLGLAPQPPRGLYIYGDVGRGKSMLMDLFFDTVPIAAKRRVHFHQFMLEINDRLNAMQSDRQGDSLPRAARAIAADSWLLCFDEFHVGNIADAMILGRLFEALFAAGVVIVATSNWAPADLYRGGLQRERFLPFIDLIQKRMAVCRLDGLVDHRFAQTRTLPCYTHPLGAAATLQLRRLFFRLTDNADPEVIELPVQGRVLRVMHTAKGVGFFNFDELCAQALGAADYLAIGQRLHTVLIDGVPIMSDEKRNETLRFVNLIDALYEARVKLYLAAAAAPEALAPPGELNFPFQRTISRLMEMQGETYRQRPHLAHDCLTPDALRARAAL